MRSQLGFVPRSPMEPVTKGRSSGTAALPRSAFAMPAPRSSAVSMSSSVACSAPAPARMATFLPALRISAAFSSAELSGT
jgi:hypothetical protein